MAEPSGETDRSIAELRAIWSISEQRLYPLATTATDLYQAAVPLVRSLADVLADVASHDDLSRRWTNRADALAAAEAESRVAMPSRLAADDVLGAAFALRDRELAAELERADRRQRVEAARDESSEWAVLHRRGDIERGLADPYQSIEFHLATCLALVLTVERDPSTVRPNFVVSVIEMDADGVDVVNIDVPGMDDRETTDVGTFEENAAAMRALILDRAAGGSKG